MLRRKIVIFAAALIFSVGQLAGMFNSSKNVVSTVMLPFFGAGEVNIAQIDALNNSLSTLKKNADNAQKKNARLITKLGNDLSEAQVRLKVARDTQFEPLNKKIMVMNTRKQIALNMQELWKEFVDLVERHISLLKAIGDYTQSLRVNPNPVYSWKDFKEVRDKHLEHITQLENDKRKKEQIQKFILAEKETAASLQRQVDVKTKEREKLFVRGADAVKGKPLNTALIKLGIEILEQEINLLTERAEYSKLKLDKFGYEEKFKEDDIAFQRTKLDDERDLLVQAERRLILDFNDVELVKTEWKDELQKALRIKDDLNIVRETKSFDRERLALELEFLSEKIKQYKEKEGGDYASHALTKSGFQKLNAQIVLLEKEIQLIDVKKDSADVAAKIKELQYMMIEVRYNLKQNRINFDELLPSLNNQRELEASAFKGFSVRRIEAVGALIENKRTVERIRLKDEKLKGKKLAIFAGKEVLFESILTHYTDARKFLETQAQVIQDYLAVCSDVIGQQEVVINHYDLIIADLESHKTTQSIWKRSPRAISIEAFKKSFEEAEIFAKKLFWTTPTYIAPSVFIVGFKTLNWWSFVLLLWFLAFFGGSFFAVRWLFAYLLQKIKALLVLYKTGTRVLYLTIAQAMVAFTVEHFSLLFTLAFLYLHILFDFNYVFCALKCFSGAYYKAVFYLISIPIFVYLAHGFVDYFKELNKKLSFLFFAEHFQDRFINLLSLFFYSTAILVPLRFAFLTYFFDNKLRFGDVLLAAYSLFLVLILLFFFTKEDVLKIIPSSNQLFLWIKRKIEKYYYPVFFFLMGLLILSNPYIGYSNLAWFLAVAVPLSMVLFYALFWVHHYIRTLSVFLFMQEDEDEIRDKFEHAKTYYGFFVIITFLVLLFGTGVLLARVWGFDLTPIDLVKLLSEDWVIQFGAGNKLGFVQFMELATFIMGGFFTSSLIHKFMLTKLFDILRTEPGLQNTISRILHYTLICLAIVLGFVTIHLEQFILVLGGLMAVGLGLAVKDILTDMLGGFLILLERPIEIGNYMQLEELEGTVHKIAARTTTLITSRNHTVVIPNRELLSKVVTNWGHGRFAVGFEIAVRVTHDNKPELVKQLLTNILQNNQMVLRVPPVVVRLEAFEENALYFLTRAFVSARRVKEQWELSSQLRMEILKVFKENNIKLALPQCMISTATSGGIEESPDALSVRFKK